MFSKLKNEKFDQSVIDLDLVREDVLNKSLIVIALLAFIPLAASLYRIVDIGWQTIMYFHVISYLIIFITTAVRRRLPFSYKALVLISFCFLIGCIATVNMGLIGSGSIFMLFSIIFATMFLEVRYGGVLILVGFIVLVTVATGINQGWIVFDFDIGTTALSLSSWISRIIAFAFFSSLLIVSLGRLITHLVDSGNILEKRSVELHKSNEKLFNKITELNRAKEALQKSEEKYRLLAQNARDVIWTTDLDLNMTYVSPSVRRVRGFTVEEIMSLPVKEQLTPESMAIAVTILAEELEIETHREKDPDRSKILQLETRCKDGSTRWNETKMSFIRDPNGEAVGILGVSRDITERKHAEEEKKILESQLAQSQKMEAIGTLAGGIAHDFNNILYAIIGYTELSLADIEKDNRIYGNLLEVLKAGNRAKELVQHILNFSRQAERELKPVQVKSVVKEALKLLRATIPTSIEIRPAIQSNAFVLGNSTQIHQILMNFSTNAVHAMEDCTGILTVKLSDVEVGLDSNAIHPELKPGQYIHLEIGDTGKGMPDSVLEKAFDPFYTTKDVGSGTGMGLSVVHGIVKSHGGAIWASSELKKGSIFNVYLPSISKKMDHANTAGYSIPTGTERILFVDDEQVIVDMGKQSLETLGYNITTTTDSLEALALFKANPDKFDLIITDMTMPKMTGEKLAKEVMQIRPGMPVILCTGFNAKIDKKKARGMDIQALISKPILKQEIARTIREVLNP